MSVTTRKKKSSRSSSSLKAAKKNDSMVTAQSTAVAPVDHSPDNMIMIAINSGRPMAEVEKLIDMRNAEIKRLAKLKYLHAMKAFQAICPNLVKKKEVKFDHRDGQGKTEYKYADLATIQDIIREPLSSMGLSVGWTTTEDKDLITVTCSCSHEGGHSESTSLSGQADTSGKKNNIQSKASTITYLRRYTLTGILGISTGDIDNDGVGAAPVAAQVKILKLEKPSAEMYKILCDSMARGAISLEELEKTYLFTDEQMETLKTLKS